MLSRQPAAQSFLFGQNAIPSEWGHGGLRIAPGFIGEDGDQLVAVRILALAGMAAPIISAHASAGNGPDFEAERSVKARFPRSLALNIAGRAINAIS